MENSRRQFLSLFTKRSIQKPTQKLLTKDGKLVEVDIDAIRAGVTRKATNEDVDSWVIYPKPKKP